MKFFYFIVNFIIQFFLTVIFEVAGIKDINVKPKKTAYLYGNIKNFLIRLLCYTIYFYNILLCVKTYNNDLKIITQPIDHLRNTD